MSKAIKANNEFFDLLSADILTRLYTMFPQRIDLDANAVDFASMNIDSEGYPERLPSLWSATVEWLADEGFIRIGRRAESANGQTTFSNVILTGQGLSALRRNGTGDKLIVAVKNISTDAAKAAATNLIIALLRAVV